MLCRSLSFAAANSDLAHRVEEDVAQPVRPIGVDGQEGWNVRASLFMYPPTFWSDHPHVIRDNWVNCMLYTASALSELSGFSASSTAPAHTH